MMFLGVPAEARKHTDLLRKAKPQAFSEEDGNAILGIARRGFQMKFFCLLSASSAFYFTTPFIPILPPLVTKTAAFFLTYRLLSVPVMMRVEKQLKEISVKYDLENKPELVLTEEEMRVMWKKMKDGSWEKEEEELKKKEEENKEKKEADKQEGENTAEEKKESAPAASPTPSEAPSDTKPKDS